MRQIGIIPHEKFYISVYEWNEKTIVKLEAGPMEQVYKYPKALIVGVEGAKKTLTPEFLQKVYDRFTAMFLDMKEVSGM